MQREETLDKVEGSFVGCPQQRPLAGFIFSNNEIPNRLKGHEENGSYRRIMFISGVDSSSVSVEVFSQTTAYEEHGGEREERRESENSFYIVTDQGHLGWAARDRNKKATSLKYFPTQVGVHVAHLKKACVDTNIYIKYIVIILATF